ncbi:hypothetical protein FQN49_007254 [Arthroderma sp. PD_2]|nr:hypothetical protein FQN49_007254 [Arthroderma sp. PD_2]
MRSAEESRALWNATFHQPEIHSLHELKQVLETGTNGPNPCENGLRSAILLHREIDQSKWSIQLSDSREAYTSVREYFLKYIDNPNELSSTVDPLAEDAESPWESLRRDEVIRAEISQDVERCLQENSFFHDPIVKLRLLDILFVFVKLNPDMGYRQGMHELLAPILWVVAQDAIDMASVNEDEAFAACGDEVLLLQSLDPKYIEHDSFILFCSVMQTAKEFYEHNDGKTSAGNSEVSSIIARSQRIHLVLLRQLDPELADHLVSIEILPQIFLTRWIRLLFGREFPFDDVLALWDLVIAENLRSSLIDMILMEADYSTALSLLLRYPSPEPIKPRTFVLDALYLEHNTTVEGASYLVAKYSGKPIPQKAQNSTPPPGVGFTPRQKSSSISRDIFSTPSSSPNRLNSKRLDSIFQDVSEGLYRRAEGWGVTKAVRGAVVEARRNMQGLQAGASGSTAFNHDGPAWDSPSPPRISLATVRDLNLKISTLEQRNKALATMLGDALDTLQDHPSTIKEKDLDGGEYLQAIDEVVARIQKVKTCLQDPAIPLESGDIPEAKQRPSITLREDSPTRAKVTLKAPLSSTADSQNDTTGTPTEQSQEKPKGEENIMPEPTKEPQSPPSSINALSPTTNTTKARPIRPARTSVRDSSFSWILGDDPARPSFATSASEPPEQRREPLKSLFTDPESDGRTAGQSSIEGLVLADLQHAPQSMQRHPDQ